MRIVEFDGTDVWFEHIEPLWTLEEVHLMNQQLLAQTLEANDLPVEWEDRLVYDYLSDTHVTRPCVTHETGKAIETVPWHQRMVLMTKQCQTYRERVGLRRSDGKPLHRTVRKAELAKVADEFGIRTSEPGWEEAAMEAIRLAPARGRIPAQT